MKNIIIVSNKRLYSHNIMIVNWIYLIHLKKYFIQQMLNFVFGVFEEFQKLMKKNNIKLLDKDNDHGNLLYICLNTFYYFEYNIRNLIINEWNYFDNIEDTTNNKINHCFNKKQ